jgi:catechol 2,3-dioxygenase-like lactoylglutathione lyase family enzyme
MEGVMALIRLNHVTVGTGDLEATRTFYENVLGWKPDPGRRSSFRAIGFTAREPPWFTWCCRATDRMTIELNFPSD